MDHTLLVVMKASNKNSPHLLDEKVFRTVDYVAFKLRESDLDVFGGMMGGMKTVPSSSRVTFSLELTEPPVWFDNAADPDGPLLQYLRRLGYENKFLENNWIFLNPKRLDEILALPHKETHVFAGEGVTNLLSTTKNALQVVTETHEMNLASVSMTMIDVENYEDNSDELD